MRLSANGRSRAIKEGWLRKMAQKQKTASAWAGLPCSFSTSKVSYLSAWPGEEGGWGVEAWRSLLFGFQRAPSLSQCANLPRELSFLAPRMRRAQGDHSSSRKRCHSKAAQLCDLPSSRLLAEGKPNLASTQRARKLRHEQEGKCAWSPQNGAKRSTDPPGIFTLPLMLPWSMFKAEDFLCTCRVSTASLSPTTTKG